MDAANAGYNWLRCRPRLQLQLPLPLSLIPFCSSGSQWICNGRAGFRIRDRGRQIFMTTEKSGSDRNGGRETGYNAMCWVCLWDSSRCWWAMTACRPHGDWCNHWLLLCRGRGGIHVFSDICHARIVQRSWRGGVLTRDCRGYGTPSLTGTPLASQDGNMTLSRWKLRITRWPTVLVCLNKSYDRNRAWVRALEVHSPI
jgi:hypothetical protein